MDISNTCSSNQSLLEWKRAMHETQDWTFFFGYLQFLAQNSDNISTWVSWEVTPNMGMTRGKNKT